MSGLCVVRAGAYTTIQDLGRPGYRGLGVPCGGAFDVGSLRLANALAGNPPTAAALEMARLGGVYEAIGPLVVALAGAAMEGRVVGPAGSTRPVRVPSAFALETGARLELGVTRTGARAYLAVHGGFEAASLLGSRSSETPTAAGAVLSALAASGSTIWPDASLLDLPTGPIAVVPGPETGPLPAGPLRVGRLADRMGLRLEGEAVPDAAAPEPDRLSAPVAPGSVQWTGAGWIVLGVAGGTMGGYPVVAQVIRADLDRLGQLEPGESVVLTSVSLDEAIDRGRRRADALDRRDFRLRAVAADRIRPGLARS